MKKLTLLGLALLAMTLITGCADSVDVQSCIPQGTYINGFWHGVWHGMISQISFFCSLFNTNIAVYAVNNNGGWYNFGFVGGLGLIIKMISLILKGIRKK